MATDPKARRISLGFDGGSLTASRGLLEALFGVDLVQQNEVATITVSRKTHSRFRVIGGNSTSVQATSYTRKRYGQAGSDAASGGEANPPLYEGEWWTARLSGSHQKFNAWLKGSTWASGKTAYWRSEKGTKYGPFKPVAALLPT